MCLAAASYALAASSAVSNVPSHSLAPRFGSRISAAQLPHGRCRTPRYCDVVAFFDALSPFSPCVSRASRVAPSVHRIPRPSHRATLARRHHRPPSSTHPSTRPILARHTKPKTRNRNEKEKKRTDWLARFLYRLRAHETRVRRARRDATTRTHLIPDVLLIRSSVVILQRIRRRRFPRRHGVESTTVDAVRGVHVPRASPPVRARVSVPVAIDRSIDRSNARTRTALDRPRDRARRRRRRLPSSSPPVGRSPRGGDSARRGGPGLLLVCM